MITDDAILANLERVKEKRTLFGFPVEERDLFPDEQTRSTRSTALKAKLAQRVAEVSNGLECEAKIARSLTVLPREMLEDRSIDISQPFAAQFAKMTLQEFRDLAAEWGLIDHADDAISNQVEIDAMRLEARLAWEARRAKMTQEERDLEDLKRALSDLELYGYTGND